MISIEMSEEGSGKDIARARRVYLLNRIGWEMLYPAILEESGPVSTVGRDEQGYKRAPVPKERIGLAALTIGKGEQIVVA